MADRNPVVINAGDIPKALAAMKKHHRFGEHGGIDDPDILDPVAIGVTRTLPKYMVRADPDGVTFNTTSTRNVLQVGELDELILALTEARDYIEIHGKGSS